MENIFFAKFFRFGVADLENPPDDLVDLVVDSAASSKHPANRVDVSFELRNQIHPEFDDPLMV